ncbi:MAG: ImmA/IrrE family metallo-endopeptidase [Actinomycetota bacterium]
MTTRVKAFANPRLLRWARESAGFDLDTAAKKVPVKPERLGTWEQGELHPTIHQLRKLARVYRRPMAAFYLAEPPPPLKTPKDFRRLPATGEGARSSHLLFEIRQATTRRRIALELLADEGEDPPTLVLEARPNDAPGEVANAIREASGIKPDIQFKWDDHYEAFNAWRAAIERIGALVLQMTEVPTQEARGFSIAEFPLPIVVVNVKDPPQARIFSLFHELTHLVIRQGGLCDFEDALANGSGSEMVERFCNSVSGSVVVPRSLLLAENVVQQHGSTPRWDESEIRTLSQRFRVSREVIVRRLLNQGMTSQDFYREKREQYQEQLRKSKAPAPGFAPPHTMALASAGPTFTSLVLSTYGQGKITASDVSDYLGIRLKHLPKIEEQLGAKGDRL